MGCILGEYISHFGLSKNWNVVLMEPTTTGIAGVRSLFTEAKEDPWERGERERARSLPLQKKKKITPNAQAGRADAPVNCN